MDDFTMEVDMPEDNASTALPSVEASAVNVNVEVEDEDEKKMGSIESKPVEVVEDVEKNMPPVTRRQSSSRQDDEDTVNDDDLSPPPATLSPVSSQEGQGEIDMNEATEPTEATQATEANDDGAIEDDAIEDDGIEDHGIEDHGIEDHGIEDDGIEDHANANDANDANGDDADDEFKNASENDANGLDEIIVGVNSNAPKASPLPIASEQDGQETDEDMDNVEDSASVSAVSLSHYPKRKRASLHVDLAEEKIEMGTGIDDPEGRPTPPYKAGGRKKAPVREGVKSHILGYWRNSEVPDAKGKHAVVGFVDSRDRLRTRVEGINRAGQIIKHQWPLPPGPGGSWVKFPDIVFEKHLVNLDHHQVKEFVKIRVASKRPDETLEEAKAADHAAVKEAITRLTLNPAADSNGPPSVAWGPIPPEHAHVARPEKKRRTDNAMDGDSLLAGTPETAGPSSQGHNASANDLPGSRPTRVLLGHWLRSDQKEPNQHAIFGILSSSDMFRVKLAQETRTGHYVKGNFPHGAGGLWVNYDHCEMLPHLKSLSRAEMKEYVRVRQYLMDSGEQQDDRDHNDQLAVDEAIKRAKPGFKNEPRDSSFPFNSIMNTNGNGNGNGYVHKESSEEEYDDEAQFAPKREYPAHGNLRGDNIRAARPARHSMPNPAEFRPANRSSNADINIERANDIARREVTKAEINQQRHDQRHAANNNKSMFEENVSRLNNVWASQEAHRINASGSDAKMYAGVKYERKPNGPFQGKLCSQGNIINIDGEDYVEYRVLTKPSFC